MTEGVGGPREAYGYVCDLRGEVMVPPCERVPRLAELCTLNMYSFLRVNHTSIESFKRRGHTLKTRSYVRLCQATNSQLPSQSQSSHARYLSRLAGACSNKTLFTNAADSGSDPQAVACRALTQPHRGVETNAGLARQERRSSTTRP